MSATEIGKGLPGYNARVAPFFKTYCVKCHGPEKSKGDITVHSLHGDLSLGQELDKWESILDMLEFGLNQGGRFHTVHAGHFHINQHNIRLVFTAFFQCLFI